MCIKFGATTDNAPVFYTRRAQSNVIIVLFWCKINYEYAMNLDYIKQIPTASNQLCLQNPGSAYYIHDS